MKFGIRLNDFMETSCPILNLVLLYTVVRCVFIVLPCVFPMELWCICNYKLNVNWILMNDFLNSKWLFKFIQYIFCVNVWNDETGELRSDSGTFSFLLIYSLAFWALFTTVQYIIRHTAALNIPQYVHVRDIYGFPPQNFNLLITVFLIAPLLWNIPISTIDVLVQHVVSSICVTLFNLNLRRFESHTFG